MAQRWVQQPGVLCCGQGGSRRDRKRKPDRERCRRWHICQETPQEIGKKKHNFIGDVRGAGLFFGTEIIKPTGKLAADKKLAKRATNLMRENGVVMGLLGRKENLFKIRPPMPFSKTNTDHLFEVMEHVLSRL